MMRDLSKLSTYYVSSTGAYVSCTMFICLSLQEHKFQVYRDACSPSLQKGTCYVALLLLASATTRTLPILLSWRNLAVRESRWYQSQTHPIQIISSSSSCFVAAFVDVSELNLTVGCFWLFVYGCDCLHH